MCNAFVYKCYVVVYKCYIVVYKCYVVVYKCYVVVYKCYVVTYKCYVVAYKCYVVVYKCYIVVYKCYVVAYKCYVVAYKCYVVAYKCYVVPRCTVCKQNLKIFFSIRKSNIAMKYQPFPWHLLIVFDFPTRHNWFTIHVNLYWETLCIIHLKSQSQSHTKRLHKKSFTVFNISLLDDIWMSFKMFQSSFNSFFFFILQFT